MTEPAYIAAGGIADRTLVTCRKCESVIRYLDLENTSTGADDQISYVCGSCGARMVIVVPERGDTQGQELHATQCPRCDESVRATARACPHCGQDLKETPSEESGTSPSDTAAWLDLFTQPAGATPLNKPLIRPLRYRRALREILATGPRTSGEAVQGIADMLGLDPRKHQALLRAIVKDSGIAAAWALAVQVKPLPLWRRRQMFFERVRRTHAPPDAAQDS